MRCPSFERLIDYLDDKLAEPDRTGVADHLASGCASCAKDRDWYGRVRATASSDDSVAPPLWVFKQAVRIFDAEKRPRISECVGRAIAFLVFDSFARPSLAGVRSSETANRQLLYRAGKYSIDVQIAPIEQAGVELIGQVLKEGETNFESVSALRIEIARKRRPVFVTATDETGEFRISGVDYGMYDLRIELSDGDITVPDLPVVES